MEISRTVNSETELGPLLETLTKKAAAALGGDRGAVFLYDEETDELWSIVATGETKEIRFPADRGVAGYVARTGQALIVPDAYTDPRFNPDIDKKTGYETRSIICSPIVDPEGGCVGVVEVLNKKDGSFTNDDLELLGGISSHVATAIRNARLYDERKKMFDSLITVLGDSIESRDPYTAGHSRAVMEYSVGIAEEMGLDADEIKAIKYAALLHDYGKIGVPDGILRKTDGLNDEEYDVIKRHVIYTRDILGKIAFEKKLRAVPEIAGSHHERMSGGGYPRGIAGDEIPLGSRLIAIADAFQAITSDRPYRKAASAAEALSEIESAMDVDFDGDAVRALKRFLVKTGIIPPPRVRS